MPELSPEGLALMRAGRAALDPSPDARDRILQSLGPRLDQSVGAGGSTASGPALAGSGPGTAARLFLALGVPAVGLGMAWAVSHYASRPTSAHLLRPAAVVAFATADRQDETDLRTSTSEPAAPGPSVFADVPASAPQSKPHSATRYVPDTLSAEVGLLGKANQELNRGQPTEALATLAEHERRFPAGALVEERMAARVEALCALSRSDEAKRNGTRLVQRYPRSPYLNRVRTACGWDDTSTP